ncbi:unnamed protein product [Clavelina lepadiformis]|uniref:DAN domain-containing protein n=1 Tax=Clavelina lepadiformis TaxID=159417 RepID=A0ABP0FD51_CLALP
MKFLLLLCLFVATTLAGGKSKWKVPGCHLRGYQKQIHVDNCKSVIIGINACRGYCPSITYPSDYATKMESNGRHNYTAQAACCTIESYERVRIYNL